MVYLTTAPLYKLFGISLFSAALSNFLYLCILLYAAYRIGVIIASRLVGITAVLLLVLHPSIYGPLRQYGLDLPLTAVVTLFFLLLLRFKGKVTDMVLLLLVASIGCLIKFQFILFVIGPLLYLLYNNYFRKNVPDVRCTRPAALTAIAAIVAVVIVIAVILRYANLTFVFSRDIGGIFCSDLFRISLISLFLYAPLLLLYDLLAQRNTNTTTRFYRIVLVSLTALLIAHLLPFSYRTGDIDVANAIKELRQNNDIIGSLIIQDTGHAKDTIDSLNEKQLVHAFNKVLAMPGLYKLAAMDTLNLYADISKELDRTLRTGTHELFDVSKDNRMILRKMYPLAVERNSHPLPPYYNVPDQPYRIVAFLKQFFFDFLGIPLCLLFLPALYSLIRNPAAIKRGYFIALLAVPFLLFFSFSYMYLHWFNPRFFMPLLPIISILIAGWLFAIPRKTVRWSFITVTLVILSVQFYYLSYRYIEYPRDGSREHKWGVAWLAPGVPRFTGDVFGFDTLYTTIEKHRVTPGQATDILVANLVPGRPDPFEIRFQALVRDRTLQTCDLWMSSVVADEIFGRFEFVVFRLPAGETTGPWPSRDAFDRLITQVADPETRRHVLQRTDFANARASVTDRLFKEQASFELIADIPLPGGSHWTAFRKKYPSSGGDGGRRRDVSISG
jgi:4-amino-4-deoxy-L-arabinose transferase-like glycosyltransferase